MPVRKQRVLIVVGSIAAMALLVIYEILWAPNRFEGDRFITISKGQTFRSVVDSLESTGIIRSRLLFEAAGRLLGSTTIIQIGKYRFKSGMSNKEILNDIQYGLTTEAILVTIPEGWKASRIAEYLARKLGIDSVRFMNFAADTAFARSLGVESVTLEGYLAPETYQFYWQSDEAEIIKALVGEFWNIFDDTLRTATAKRGMTVNEIVTLASIIEMETSIDAERPIIAGVYYNRLKRRMRLQADPTIQYLLQEQPRLLRFNDLYIVSAYNTYRNYGLPPGPINNPGRVSILAALYPKKHSYLYFVANGQGGHEFTKTFDAHLRAKRKLQKLREVRQAASETS